MLKQTKKGLKIDLGAFKYEQFFEFIKKWLKESYFKPTKLNHMPCHAP